MVKGVRPLAAMPTTTSFLRRLLLGDLLTAQLAGVFVGLYGCGEGFGAAGDDELDHARARIEGGRAFGGVERGDASAGAGADVDEASAAAKARRRSGRWPGRSGARRASRRPRPWRLRALMMRAISSADLAVEIGGGGVGFLRGKAAKIQRLVSILTRSGFGFKRSPRASITAS